MNKSILVVLAALALAAGSMAGWHWLSADPPSVSAALAEAGAEPASPIEPSGHDEDWALAAPEAVLEPAPAPLQDVLARLPAELQQVLSERGRSSADTSDWSRQPVLPNLERWRRIAEQDPERAAALADALRKCAPGRGLLRELEFAEARWREDVERVHSSRSTLQELEAGLNVANWNFSYRAAALLRCDGFSDRAARREYIRWLEHAARELPPSPGRDQLRLSFIDNPFIDLGTAGERISSIEEVLRRRDVARAWLRELREAGDLLALIQSKGAFSIRGELEPLDEVESVAWGFVYDVRAAEAAASRRVPYPHEQQSASDIWVSGVRWMHGSDSPDPEGLRRGREHYLRIFGAPPG